jgi:hypothetical protein
MTKRLLRTISASLLVMALCVGTSAAQTVQSSGSLSFPAHQLTGAPYELAASVAPIYQIDWLGTFPSFELTLEASQLVSGTGQTLSPALLTFTSEGASFVTLEGDLLDIYQVETATTASLDNPMLVVTAPAGLSGRWRYLPLASNFRLHVPAEAYNGVYQAELTATITGGP